MNSETINAIVTVALCNIVISSFLACVLRSKCIPIIWTLVQTIVICATLDALYVSAFGALFIFCSALLMIICYQKDEEKLGDIRIVKVKMTESKPICVAGWSVGAAAAGMLGYWKKSLASPLVDTLVSADVSLCSEDNCLIILIAFLLFVSLIGCVKFLDKSTVISS
jgi:hypothetical protein